MTTGVYITFDVECSLGGAAYRAERKPVPPSRGMMGQTDREALGVPRIVEILAAHDLRATFFVEPLNDELGWPGQTQPVCEYLLDRDQDVQLHIHPNRLAFADGHRLPDRPLIDDIADLPRDSQLELLQRGIDRLTSYTGTRPVAFRAGNLGASEQTLRQLADVGILVDSSYAFPFAGGQCRFSPESPYNGSKRYGRVVELALSGFYQPDWPGLRPAKPLDLMGISFAECRDAIERICSAGADSVLILHSFSLFKRRDTQYARIRPDRVVTRRFRQLCRWLADRGDLPVRTFAELDSAIRAGEYRPRAVPPPRLRRPFRALARKAVQVLNTPYWT
jgi:peptidoglycan/xylan/chitin deacetylase (PgdA/CDA1 family)